MKITENTSIQLSLIGSIAVTVVGGVWWLSSMYYRVAQAENNISTLQVSQKEVVNQLQLMNGTLIEIKTEIKNQRR
jgi:hypothetical protein